MNPARRRGLAGCAIGSLLALLVLVLGLLYLTERRGREAGEVAEVDLGRAARDVEEAGEAAAQDLDQAVGELREKSREALTTAKVKTALGLSKTVSAFDIDVDTAGRRVTLRGRVPSAEVKQTALQIAKDTSGVVEVVDLLEVAPGVASGGAEIGERLADAELKSLVYEGFLEDEEIDARSIRVLVEDRIVTLIGSVSSARQKERAEEIARSIGGVESVESRLAVRTTKPRVS